MSSFGYYKGMQGIYEATIDVLTDDIRIALLTASYLPNQTTHEFFSDVSTNEVASVDYASVLLTNKSIVSDDVTMTSILHADDIEDWATAKFKRVRYAVIYKDTGVEATSPLIALIDFGGTRNAPITIRFPDGVFGFRSSEGQLSYEDFEDGLDPNPNWTYVNTGWDNQVNPDICPLTSDNFDSITIAWEHYVDCETAGSPYGFDAVSDVNGQMRTQTHRAKQGEKCLRCRMDGTGTAAYGYNTSAAKRTQYISSFWMHYGEFTTPSGNSNVFRMTDAGTPRVFIRISESTPTSYNMILFSREDAGTYQAANLVVNYNPADILFGEWSHFVVAWRAATAAGANNGYTYVWIDGVLVASITGLDNDTFNVDEIQYGYTNGSVNPTGAVFFDDIYDDYIGSVQTIKLEGMGGGIYSMMCATIGNSTVGSVFSPASGTDIWQEFDFKKNSSVNNSTVTIGNMNDSVAVKNLYVFYDPGADEIDLWWTDDTGVLTANSFDVSGFGDVLTICVYWYSASAPAANDGIVMLFINGELQYSKFDADTDTLNYDGIRFGSITSVNYPQVLFFGVMRYSTELAPITIKSWAANQGDYGACQYISPNSNSAEFYRPLDNPSSTFAGQINVNYNNLTIGDGDTFTHIVFRKTGGLYTGLITVTRNGANYYVTFMYLTPAFTYQSIGTWYFSADKHVTFHITYSASGTTISADGYMFAYVDGLLEQFDEDINTAVFDADNTSIYATNLDATTYGAIFYDDILFADQAVFLNPLNGDYENASDETVDFYGSVIPDLEAKYFIVVEAYILSKPGTIPGKPELNIAGQAQYKVILRETDGTPLAQFDNWNSLVWTRINNVRHNIRFQPIADDPRRKLFTKDRIIEVWRKNDIVNLDWYKECEGLYRTKNQNIDVSDRNSFVAFALGGIDLLVRAHVMWYEGSAQADKSGAGETVMKEYVYENIGAGALAASGRIADNVMPYFEIEADAGLGDIWTGQKSYGELYETLRAISDVSAIDFEVVGDLRSDAYYWIFKTWYKQRTDRTIDNTDGNTPVVFDIGRGNMRLPTFSRNATIEKTAVYAIGQGRLSDALIVLQENADAIAESPWNRSEIVVKGSNEQNDETSLSDLATQRLFEEAERVSIDFDALQTKSCYYGIHYFLGDRVSSIFDGERIDKKIRSVKGIISNAEQGEQLNVEFEATPGVGGYEA